MFTNREIATLVWIAILVIYSLFTAKVRISLGKVLKTLSSWKILIYILSSCIYFAGLIFLLNYLIVLDASLLKDSLIWFVSSGLILTAKSFSSKSTSDIVSRQIVENIQLFVIIEFVIASYVFPFIVELIIFPIIAIISLLLAVSENDRKYAEATKVLKILQFLTGTGVLCFSIYSAVLDFKNIGGTTSLKSFFLPFILMFAYFPLSYCWILYAKYEELFTVIKQMYKNLKNEELGNKVRKRIFAFCGINYNRVKAIRNNDYYFWHFIEREEQIDEFINYNKSRTKYIFENAKS